MVYYILKYIFTHNEFVNDIHHPGFRPKYKINEWNDDIQKQTMGTEENIEETIPEFKYLDLYTDKPVNKLWSKDPIGRAEFNNQLEVNISIIFYLIFNTIRWEKLKIKCFKKCKKCFILKHLLLLKPQLHASFYRRYFLGVLLDFHNNYCQEPFCKTASDHSYNADFNHLQIY